MYIESTARTNKLYCSDCGNSIKKGDLVVFVIEGGRMEDVYCPKCSKDYDNEVYNDSLHPYSGEALEQ